MKYTIAVDFDGVIHRYDTPWKAPHIVPDEPVDGAIEWLIQMVGKFDVVIFSTRCKTWRGRLAVRRWLKRHAGACWNEGLGVPGLEVCKLSAIKPPALVYIDDRAMRFEGSFPTVQEIHAAKPWHKCPPGIAR